LRGGESAGLMLGWLLSDSEGRPIAGEYKAAIAGALLLLGGLAVFSLGSPSTERQVELVLGGLTVSCIAYAIISFLQAIEQFDKLRVRYWPGPWGLGDC